MLEKGIRGGTCQAIVPFVKANNKYLKNHDKSLPSLSLKYIDANNLYRLAKSVKSYHILNLIL